MYLSADNTHVQVYVTDGHEKRGVHDMSYLCDSALRELQTTLTWILVPFCCFSCLRKFQQKIAMEYCYVYFHR